MSTINKFIEHAHKFDGCSFNVNSGELNPDKGFMVSLAGRERKVAILDTLEVVNFIKDNSDLLMFDQYYIGAWLNDGLWVLDVSENFSSFMDALYAGHERKQIAIWDCEKGDAINLQDQYISLYVKNDTTPDGCFDVVTTVGSLFQVINTCRNEFDGLEFFDEVMDKEFPSHDFSMDDNPLYIDDYSCFQWLKIHKVVGLTSLQIF